MIISNLISLIFNKNILSMAAIKTSKFIVTGANSLLGYDVIRALNIKYNANNVLACDPTN